MSLWKRNRKVFPLGWNIEISPDNVDDNSQSDSIKRLIGTFDQYKHKYLIILTSCTLFASTALFTGIGLGIFHLLSIGEGKQKIKATFYNLWADFLAP